MNIGRRIRYARGLRSITQAELAHEIRAPVALVKSFEAGIVVPAPGYLVLLSKALGVSVDYLLSPSNSKGLWETEQRMLDSYRKLDLLHQDALCELAETLLEGYEE